MAIMSKEVQ